MSTRSIPRASPRRRLSLMVKSRVESRAVNVDLVDISEGGCKVRGSQGFASVGDRVTMKVGEVYAPVGRIAWVEGRYAGVSYEGEMHAAVLDHLCAIQIPDLATEPDIKDRFV